MLYFQIGAIRYDPSNKTCVGQFCEYVEPTGPIPVAASKVNGLFFFGDRLCKKTDGGMVPLPAIPARLAMDKFAKWLLDIQNDSDIESKQVICLGYNNSSFDDHFLMAHWKKKLEPEIFSLIRRKLFTADVQKIVSAKGILVGAFWECGGTQEEAYPLHDALQDCKAAVRILKTI